MSELVSATDSLGFEVMGSWDNPITQRRRTWVRFSVGTERDAFSFSRILDSIDCLLVLCRPDLRAAIALDPRGERWDRCAGYTFCQDLAHADREQIELLQARAEEEIK